MNRFAHCALLVGCAVLTACGGGGAGSIGAPVSQADSSATGVQEAAPLTAVDATGAPLTSLSFASADPTIVRTVTVQQATYAGSFTESDTCKGIVTVTIVSNAGGTAVLHVSPAAGGSCNITVTGTGAQQITIPVGVTSTPISVN